MNTYSRSASNPESKSLKMPSLFKTLTIAVMVLQPFTLVTALSVANDQNVLMEATTTPMHSNQEILDSFYSSFLKGKGAEISNGGYQEFENHAQLMNLHQRIQVCGSTCSPGCMEDIVKTINHIVKTMDVVLENIRRSGLGRDGRCEELEGRLQFIFGAVRKVGGFFRFGLREEAGK